MKEQYADHILCLLMTMNTKTKKDVGSVTEMSHLSLQPLLYPFPMQRIQHAMGDTSSSVTLALWNHPEALAGHIRDPVKRLLSN